MHRKVFVSDLQKMHNITKPAISQMLNGLEHKGYISREMDKDDRRKVSVTLTDKGKAMLEETKKFADKTLDETIERFGEDNIRQLISLFNRLIDISNEIKEEKLTTTSKGETDLD
jgi:DNA-binding MarR family transcriptional regulator